MSTVITGGAGFLGTLVTERILAADPVARVISVDLAPSRVDNPRVHSAVGDLTDPTCGALKVMGELLVAEYSRKGFSDGRVCRLPTISARPGSPNSAASSFASGIIREPSTGVASTCPVPHETRMWLSSPDAAVANRAHAMGLAREQVGRWPVMNVPGFSVAVELDIVRDRTFIEVVERYRARFAGEARALAAAMIASLRLASAGQFQRASICWISRAICGAARWANRNGDSGFGRCSTAVRPIVTSAPHGPRNITAGTPGDPP